MSERIASSVAIPPALRIMCASPGRKPRQCSNRIRESMQASTATCRFGLTNNSPSLKFLANSSLAFNSSSATDNDVLLSRSSVFSHCSPVVGKTRCCPAGETIGEPTPQDQFTLTIGQVNLDDTIVAMATPPG